MSGHWASGAAAVSAKPKGLAGPPVEHGKAADFRSRECSPTDIGAGVQTKHGGLSTAHTAAEVDFSSACPDMIRIVAVTQAVAPACS
jgi:hypothetical protein